MSANGSNVLSIIAIVISALTLFVSIAAIFWPSQTKTTPIFMSSEDIAPSGTERFNLGDLVFLQAQTNPEENGMYIVDNENWIPLPPQPQSQSPSQQGVTVEQPRPITPSEMNQPVIVTKADVSMPDPEEIGMNKAGSLRLVMIANSSETDTIEVGYSAKWNLRCTDTNVQQGQASAFVFFMTTDQQGEIYRVG